MLQERVSDWTGRWLREGMEKGIEQGIEKGLERGLEKGRREGRQEGRKEGELLLLQRQLEHKFGPLGEDVRARLEAAGDDQLLSWGKRLLNAGRLEEVFDPGEPAGG